MVVKYAVEASSLWMINSVFLKPVDFLNPVFSIRQELVRGAPEWLGWAWFFWTLPFLWIAVTMSVRRSVCSGRSSWIGLLVLVPVVNLATMLMLTALSDRQPRKTVPRPDHQSDIRVEVPAQRFRRAALGVFVGLWIGFVMACVSIYAFDTYGASLFLGTPVLMGAVASLISNSATRRKYSASITLGMLTVVLAGGALLVVGLGGSDLHRDGCSHSNSAWRTWRSHWQDYCRNNRAANSGHNGYDHVSSGLGRCRGRCHAAARICGDICRRNRRSD